MSIIINHRQICYKFMTRYRRENTSVSMLNYHFIWIPRRRKRVLAGSVKNRLEELIYDKCLELEISVISLAIEPDHVHLFVNAKPDIAPSQIVFRVKGYAARILRKEFPVLLKLPSMWTRSYFVSTAGDVSTTTIQKYIDAQGKD